MYCNNMKRINCFNGHHLLHFYLITLTINHKNCKSLKEYVRRSTGEMNDYHTISRELEKLSSSVATSNSIHLLNYNSQSYN